MFEEVSRFAKEEITEVSSILKNCVSCCFYCILNGFICLSLIGLLIDWKFSINVTKWDLDRTFS